MMVSRMIYLVVALFVFVGSALAVRGDADVTDSEQLESLFNPDDVDPDYLPDLDGLEKRHLLRYLLEDGRKPVEVGRKYLGGFCFAVLSVGCLYFPSCLASSSFDLTAAE